MRSVVFLTLAAMAAPAFGAREVLANPIQQQQSQQQQQPQLPQSHGSGCPGVSLGDEIQIRQSVLNNLESQLDEAENNSGLWKFMLLVGDIGGVATPVFANLPPFVKVMVSGIFGGLAVKHGQEMLVAKARLPEIRARIQEERAYLDLLRARHARSSQPSQEDQLDSNG